MIRFIFLLFFSSSVFAGQGPSFSLDSLPLNQVLKLVYSEAFAARSYFMDPVVVADSRVISFRYRSSDGEFLPFFKGFMSRLGYSVDRKQNVDFIGPASVPKPETMVYRPLYRDGDFLLDSISSVLAVSSPQKGSFYAPTTEFSKALPTGRDTATDSVSKANDFIIFQGAPDQLVLARSLLKQLDIPHPQVTLRAVVYEFTDSETNASALSTFGSLFNGKLSVDFTNSLSSGVLRFTSSDFNLAVSLLDQDSRFKSIVRPSLLVKDGVKASFQSGDDVPTLSNVQNDSQGNPVQSIVYRPSGIIFTVTPSIHQNSISVALTQEISNFSQTVTGVVDSPTLSKRTIDTSATLEKGSGVVLGGLTYEKDGGTRSRFWGFPVGRSIQNSKTEILVFLMVDA